MSQDFRLLSKLFLQESHSQTRLEGIVTNADARSTPLPVLTAAARRQVLVEWNATHTEYPSEQCLPHLIEAQVERTPEAIAVIFEDQQLTYRELNQRANQLAHYLQTRGVGPEVLVGIYMDRSLEMVVGLLGILKAGGAYVPLDPAYPQERLAFMCEDAQLSLLLTQHQLVTKLPVRNAAVVCLDRDWRTIARESEKNPDGLVTPDNLVYVIYTSGSTGKPKGVQVLQRGVVNFLSAMRHRPGLSAQDTLLAVTTLSFDIAALELFLPLTVGARVILVSREVARDGLRLKKTLGSSGATVMQATPATWHLLLEVGWQGNRQLTILCGGEALSQELATQLLPKVRALWNLYGPTETTIWSTVYSVTGEKGLIPIGRPIANTEVYILDAVLQPVPIGIVGELYIGGVGVARGYLHRPELTAERFIPHPFRQKSGARLYKTGDLARYRPDGNIEFMGRADHQVKIRGFRIELGEIEAALEQHPGVAQAVVVAREDQPGDKRLVAYVVPTQQPAPSRQEIQHFLQEQLPDYMVPTTFVWLERLPLTPNGKIDRRALPAPHRTLMAQDRSVVAPRDHVEKRLAQLWQKVLNTGPISVQDNFFELGGNSLLAARLVAQIERMLGQACPLALLFQSPTVEQLANILRQEGWTAQWSLVVPLQPDGDKPPFFCVSGVTDLARHVGTDQPYYGLQPHGLDGRRAPSTIEDMAADYLTQIQGLQPEGPYFLGGFSLGAIVAFEMAQQLQKRGQKVALLVLFDPFGLSNGDSAPSGNPPVLSLDEIDRQFRAQTQVGVQEKLTGALKKMKRNVRRKLEKGEHKIKQLACQLYLIRGRRLPPSLRRFYFLEAARQAARQYVPHRYPGLVLLFKAKERSYDPQLDWGTLAAGGLEIYEIPGDHASVFKEPHVQVLAKQLRPYLS